MKHVFFNEALLNESRIFPVKSAIHHQKHAFLNRNLGGQLIEPISNQAFIQLIEPK